MPSFWKPFSSSSASSSPCSDSTQKVKHGSKSFGWVSRAYYSLQRKRLTRQKNLRYISDDEVGVWPQSMPVSPESFTLRSAFHWSKSAVPQPLPLPDVNLQPKLNINNDHLPLSREGFSKIDGDPSASANTSISGLSQVKAIDQTAIKFPRTPTYARRGFLRRLNIECSEPEFRSSVPPKSAPTSVFSSPVHSPNKFSAGDIFFSSDHHGRHNIIASADHSPLHSPKTRHSSKLIYKHSSNQYMHHKPLMEHHPTWHGSNNGTSHPLPLPPGVSRPIQSPITQHYMDSPEPSTVKGQWQKGKLIGRGTYGSVYVATHRETGALCALKEVDLIPDDPRCAECIKQLEQEIRVLRQLQHPNIVQYYGSEIIEDHFCIYLEFIHPGSINKYARDHFGAVTESVVRNFTRHILSGLAYLHSKKTIHRDIKGANLLVNTSGVVKLADFGVAKHLSGSVVNLSLKGTPQWMAPEVLQAVLRNNSTPDHACAVDIWSLGCTVIEMFTGKPPWDELTEVQAMFSVLHKTPPIPETLSSDGKDFLKKCLQREPMNRPSAVELLDHPFVQNIREQTIATCTEEFSGIKLLDSPSSPEESNQLDKELMLLRSKHRSAPLRQLSDSEILPCSHPENSDRGRSANNSPRTQKILPGILVPEPKGSSSHVSSSNSPDTLLPRDRKNTFFLRNHENQILHF
ncbi:hypothetical protein Leryth_003672 [Lithospermum erythrorhizon]|nr:hypothetical protein Leryth_003672 [Lithospermum erythrorhizon]